MIIRQIVVVSDQISCIGEFFNRSAQRIRNFQSDVAECGNQSTVIYQEGLSFFIVYQPVQEVFCCLTLLVCDALSRVDVEVFGTAAYKLGVGAVIQILGNRHNTHILCVIILVDYGPVPVAAEHESDFAFSQLLRGNLTLCCDCRILSVVISHKYIKSIHKGIEFLIVDEIGSSLIQALNKGFRIFLLLIYLGKEMSGQRPVLFQDTNR